jgi:hypothetical protein
MWNPVGTPANLARLGTFEPVDVLLEFEGLRIFTTKDADGELLLAFQVADTDDLLRYYVVPFSQAGAQALRDGTLSIREAIDLPRGWLVDIGHEWRPTRAWSVEGLVRLPETVVPKPSVYLAGESLPLLSVKATGARLTKFSVPASVVTRTMTNSTRALRRLVGYAIDRVGGVNGSATWEALSDPPVVLVAASFSVSFFPPAARPRRLFPDETGKVMDEVRRLLSAAVGWAADVADQPAPVLPSKDDTENQVILQCLADLTPPLTGSIENVEIGGTLISGGTAKLDRVARRIVTGTQRHYWKDETSHLREEVGVITNVDWLEKRFRLMTTEHGEVHFQYGPEMYDSALEAYHERYLVLVVGRTVSASRIVATVIAPIPDAAPGAHSS